MLGFVLLSHREPEQVRRLINTLNATHDFPPIACHHDQSQSQLDTKTFPPNVYFVEPSRPTPWAKWQIVESTLATIELLYERSDPDYFFLISGADYPTARAEKVRADVLGSGIDAFIDHFSLDGAMDGKIVIGDAHLAHHRAPHNLKLERDHYQRAQIKVPVVRFRPPAYSSTRERFPRLGAVTMALPFDARGGPFHSDYRCYCGSQWFTGSRRVAARLLSPSPDDLRLRRHYQNRVMTDESYFQTVICNDPALTVTNRTFRFAIWDGAHPIDLTAQHYEALAGSGAHFSRKFRASDPVLDQLDHYLGQDGNVIPLAASRHEIAPQHARRQA